MGKKWNTNIQSKPLAKVQPAPALTKVQSPPSSAAPTKYVKIKGTQIQFQKGGVAVRFVAASGKQFPVNDIIGVEKHLEKISKSGVLSHQPRPQGEAKPAKGVGKGSVAKIHQPRPQGGAKPAAGKGSVAKNIQKQAKERAAPTMQSEEQREAKYWKDWEKNQELMEKEGRVVCGTAFYTGEVVSSNRNFAWVKPTCKLPGAVMGKLQVMNEEHRQKAAELGKTGAYNDGDVIYVRAADAEYGVKLESGLKVKFQVYTDNRGVGACDVKAAT